MEAACCCCCCQQLWFQGTWTSQSQGIKNSGWGGASAFCGCLESSWQSEFLPGRVNQVTPPCPSTKPPSSCPKSSDFLERIKNQVPNFLDHIKGFSWHPFCCEGSSWNSGMWGQRTQLCLPPCPCTDSKAATCTGLNAIFRTSFFTNHPCKNLPELCFHGRDSPQSEPGSQLGHCISPGASSLAAQRWNPLKETQTASLNLLIEIFMNSTSPISACWVKSFCYRSISMWFLTLWLGFLVCSYLCWRKIRMDEEK